jgi:hypothetical protein
VVCEEDGYTIRTSTRSDSPLNAQCAGDNELKAPATSFGDSVMARGTARKLIKKCGLILCLYGLYASQHVLLAKRTKFVASEMWRQ